MEEQILQSRGDFSFTVSMDLILVLPVSPEDISVGFADNVDIQEDGAARYIYKTVTKSQKDRDKRYLTDDTFKNDHNTVKEYLLTTFEISESEFAFHRMTEERISNHTALFLLRETQIIFQVSFYDLAFYKMVKGTGRQQAYATKVDTPTQRDTLLVAIERQDLSKAFEADKSLQNTYPRQPESQIEQLFQSQVSRNVISQQLLATCGGTKAIVSILEAVVKVGKSYIYPDSQTYPADVQTQIWDNIVMLFLSQLLMPQASNMEGGAEVNRVALQNACAIIQQFRFNELTEFLQENSKLIRIVAGPGTFLQWLLVNQVIIQEDLQLYIDSPPDQAPISNYIKMYTIKNFKRLIIGHDINMRATMLCRLVTEYIRNEVSTSRILGLIKFLSVEVKVYHTMFSELMGEDERVRHELFAVLINLMIKISKSSIEYLCINITKDIVLNGLLRGVPGLPLEFFRMVFDVKLLLSVPIIKMFFELATISGQEKIDMLQGTLLRNGLVVGIETSAFIGELIKNPSLLYCPNPDSRMDFEIVFPNIDQRLPVITSPEEMLKMATKRGTLSEFTIACIVAYDQKLLLGQKIDNFFKGSRLETNHKIIKTFLTDPEKYMQLNHMLNISCFSKRVIDLFEALNEDDYTPFKLKLIQIQRKGLEIATQLQKSISILDQNSNLLEHYSFYNESCGQLQKFKSKFEDLTIDEVKATDEYKIFNLLSQTHFVVLERLCEASTQYMRLLRQALPTECTLEECDRITKQVFTEYVQKISSFVDPKKFTVLECLENFSEDMSEESYNNIFELVGFPERVKKVISDHRTICQGFLKVARLTRGVDNLTNGNVLKLKPNSSFKNMKKVRDSLGEQDFRMLTIAAIQKLDSPGLYKNPASQDPFLTQLPYLAGSIGMSPHLMKFLDKNGNTFIKTMREEVDNENIELVNRLDSVNKNLKFILKEDDLTQAINKLAAIDKSEQDRLVNYISILEGMVEITIQYLADKTKKDSGYSHKQIGGLLAGSDYTFHFNQTENEFLISAHYMMGDQRLPVPNTELSELMNKTLIIVSEKGTSASEDDEYVRRISRFSEVTKNLLSIKKQLKSLKDLGVIDDDFNNLSHLSLKCNIQAKQGISSGDLVFTFKRDTGINDLGVLYSTLEVLRKDFDKILRQSYRPDSALMASYSGKKLYNLIEYLTGRLTKDFRIQNCLNVMLEAHPVEGFSQIDFKKKVQNQLMQATPEVKLRHTQQVMREWTKEVVTKREVTSKKLDSFFMAKKILLYKSCKNIFSVILKIMVDCNCSNMSISQFLFCTDRTTPEQVLAFTKRALMDKASRPFFLIHLQRTGFTGINEFTRTIENLSDEEWQTSNTRIITFIEPDSATRELDDCHNIKEADTFIEKLNDTVTNTEVKKLFAEGLSKINLVMSEVSGMGKTTFINKKCEGQNKVDLFLAGDITLEAAAKRINNTIKSIEAIQGDFSLIIKLDFIENFARTYDLIDSMLFDICFLNKVDTGYGCYIFKDKIKKIYIEIGNTFSADLLGSLSIIQFISQAKECVHMMPVFDIQNINFSNDEKAAEQVVGNFLKEYEKRSVKITSESKISKSEFIKLINKHFIERVNAIGSLTSLTYARYNYWLKTVHHIVSGLTTSKELKKDAELIQQISEEVLDFSTNVIGLSVKHVKTSQDQMVNLIKSIDKNKLREDTLAQYQNSIKDLLNSWNTREMIIPMTVKNNLLIALANLDMFNEGTKRHGKRIELKKLVIEKQWYVDTENMKMQMTDMYLTILCNLLDRNFEEVKESTFKFRNTGFTLTTENYLKICLIIFKAELNIPIIMMGESGCGKTYLSHYVAECLLGETILDLTLYSGVTEDDFINFMKSAIEKAKEDENKRVWILFDEFNTSCLQSIVAEIMIDRVCSINKSVYTIPKNIVFIACCNPYRMKSKMANVGLVSRTTGVVLSHRVYPIPERLIDYVWDFGQLTEEDEKSILKGIVKAEKFFDERQYTVEENFASVIYECHKFVRDLEERSGVSLRDIKRVLRMYKWFSFLLSEVYTITKSPDLEGEHRIRFWSLTCSLMVCYGLRLNGRKEQTEFLQILTNNINVLLPVKKFKRKEIHDLLPRVADFFLNELKREGTGILGEGTALNRPLKENFMTMIAAFDTITPMIICGAPGTSKTLSTHILNSAFVPHIMNKYPIFKIFKQGINSIYYGGSETSTSEGISNVFRRGERYIEGEGEDKPVVIFDEVGLAELSPYNPLKILHPLLEKKDMKVGFIGLSNWTLDLSKMNRLIYISRPDMEQNDLNEIFESTLQSVGEMGLSSTLKSYLYTLSKAYLKYREWQKDFAYHPNFHGSRDIYSVSKFFFTSLQNIKSHRLKGLEATTQNKSESEQSKILVKIGIERNFGGTTYEFGAKGYSSNSTIRLATVSDLESELEHGLERTSEKNRTAKLGDIYSTFPNNGSSNLEDGDKGLQLRKANSSTQLHYFTSSQVFKKMFKSELSADMKNQFSNEFMTPYGVFDLINSSINDQTSRFMLVRSEGEIVENILIEKVRNSLGDNKIVDWRGMSKRESTLELFSNIKSYISLGYFLIMKNLDDLYGSLYDLFNQKFSEVDGRKYCLLYFGESKHRVEVHPNFNCIILIEADDGSSIVDIELSQPAPFLNRFEKYHLKVSDVFPGSKLDELLEVRELSMQVASGKTNHAIALSMDMVSSICISCQRREAGLGYATSNGSELEEGRDLNIKFPDQAKLLYRLTTLNYILRKNLSDNEKSLLISEHPYTNFRNVLQSVSQGGTKRLCLFTFSNPMELDSMAEDIKKEFSIDIMKSDELYTTGLESRTRMIKNYPHKLLIVQFITSEHLPLITQLKATLSENTHINKVIFVVHLDKVAKRREILKTSVGLNFWADWDNRVLDNLRYTDYAKTIELKEYTLEDLLINDKSKFMRGALQEIVIACFQRIAMEKIEVSVKENLNFIRRAIERDQEDLFINTVRDRLKEMDIMNKDEKWVDLVSKKESQNYVDFEKEVTEIFLDNYGDKAKKIVSRMNHMLKNFAGYSFGLTSRDHNVYKLYQDKLKSALSEIRISKNDLNRRAMNEDFNKVPFLSEIYSEFLTETLQKIFESNKTVLANLADYSHKLAVYKNKNRSNNDIQALKDKIEKGEKYLDQQCTSYMQPIFEKIDSLLNLERGNTYLNELILEDLLMKLLSQPRLQFSNQIRNTGLLLQFCKVVNPRCANITSDLKNVQSSITTAVYLLGAVPNELKMIMEMVITSNVHSEKVKEIVDLLMTSPSENSHSPYNLGKITELALLIQASLVPNLKTTNIPELRLALESALDCVNRQQSITVKDTVILNFNTLAIALGLVEIMPENLQHSFINKLETSRVNLEEFNKQLGYQATHKIIEKILVDHYEECTNKKRFNLLMGEYIRVCGNSEIYDFFSSSGFDKAVKSLQDSSALDTFSSIVAKSVGKSFSPFWNMEKFEIEAQKSDSNEDIKHVDSILQKFKVTDEKFRLVTVHLVDYLYLRSVTEEGIPIDSISKIANHLQLLKNKCKSVETYYGYTGIMTLVMMRRVMEKNVIEQVLQDSKLSAEVDSMLLNIMSTKDDFFVNIYMPVLIYFMQRIYQIYGDIQSAAGNLKSIKIAMDLIESNGETDLILVGMNDDLNNHINNTGDLLHSEVSKQDIGAIQKMLDSKFKNSNTLNLYAIGIVLMNRFMIAAKSESEAHIRDTNMAAYVDAFTKIKLPSRIKEVFSIIVMSKLDNIDLFFTSEDKHQTNIKLVTKMKKTIAHMLLITALFPNLGYTFDSGQLIGPKSINNMYLQSNLASSENLSNFASVMMNILRERLGDGSYQDYGAGMGRNLGIYQCSCKLVYTIGNCGYAMEKSKCPRCGNTIGGGNHQAVQRDGHKHITSLEQLKNIIEEEFNSQKESYQVHPALSGNSTELIIHALREFGMKQLIELRNKLNDNQVLNHKRSLHFKHIIDHVFLYYYPLLTTSISAADLENKYIKVLELKSKDKRELLGKINGKFVDSSTEYFSYHIRNDFDQLKTLNNANNLSEVLDYLNAVIPKLALELDSKQSEIKTFININPQWDQNTILKQFEQEKQFQVKNLDQQFTFIKSVIQKKVESENVSKLSLQNGSGGLRDKRMIMVNSYPLMRHTSFDKLKLLETFKNKLDNSPYVFLKSIVRYDRVLEDFPRMVMANLDLALHFNNHYSRVFTFDETTHTKLTSLQDSVLQDQFNEFKAVWTTVIPTHEDTNPEVFSFAFMCNQNLNVANFIDEIIKNGKDELVSFLLVDSSEEFAGRETLYMKSIIRTFLEGFHNKLISQAKKVLGAEEATGRRRIEMEYLSKEDLVSQVDWERVVLDNIWVNGDVINENELNFNFERIEYTLAKYFIKNEINCEENHIKFFNFKNSRVTESEQVLKGLSTKITVIPLTEDQVLTINDMSTEEVEQSLKFILEVGDYISRNFLFENADILISELITLNKNQSMTKRFGQYNHSKHANLKVGQIAQFYELVNERHFMNQLNAKKKSYSKPLNTNIKDAVAQECEKLDIETLMSFLLQFKEEVKCNFFKKGFQDSQIGLFMDLEEIFGVSMEPLEDATFSSYFTIVDIIDEVIYEKKKKSN